MMNNIYGRLCFFFIVFLCMLYPSRSCGADTFSVTLPAGAEVTMQNPNSVLSFTVTNNSATKNINEITFNVNTALFRISSSTVPPPGWCVKDVGADSIVFSLAQPAGSCSSAANGSQILPGQNLVFNIMGLPQAAAADVAGDTLTSVTVGVQGGFSLSGAPAQWTRRSLDFILSAAPAFTGVGGAITLTGQVTNRSTAAQAAINSTPAPPSPSNAIVTSTAGPYYGSTALTTGLTSSATSIAVSSTSEFAATGTIRIDSEDICYTGKTANSITGGTRGCNATTASAHLTGAAVYSLNSYSLAPNETRTLLWKYSADITGSVYFTSRAANSAATAKSMSVNSNTVVIAPFTAVLSVSPVSVTSGQDITVQMTVSNNGTAALINIVPAALTGCAGGATETFVSGPSPASITSLPPGSSGAFYWTYRVTGALGQSYCLSGGAAANGPVSTNAATSNSGTVSSNSVTIAPSVIKSGTVNQGFTWTVYNGSGCTVREVDITAPTGGGNWTCGSTAPPAGWSGPCGGTVQFNSPNSGADIPSGSSRSFSITFSATETVSSDKVVPFPVLIIPRGCGGEPDGTLGTNVTVTANGITLTNAPAGPIYADGSSMYAMTATLTSGGSPVAGKTITFSTTNGALSSTTAVTDVNGQASVNLTAPNSATNTAAAVTAAYMNASGADTVNFNGWTKGNLQYWGGLAPASVNCGGAYSFTMTVKNISSTSMSINTGSYFAFNDYSSGGATVCQAYLDTAATIPPGATQALSFGSPTSSGGGGGVSVPSSMLAGTYLPVQNPAPPPASGLFFTDGGANDQYRGVSDNITAGGANCGTVNVNVIEWREMR